MKRKLSVILILAAALVCTVLFSACVENVAYASDMYGTYYLAGNYDPEAETPDETITDFDRRVVLKDNDGDPWASVNFGGVATENDEASRVGFYADYDLTIGNTIKLKKDGRHGDVAYTINILSKDVLSVELPAEENGKEVKVACYFVRDNG